MKTTLVAALATLLLSRFMQPVSKEDADAEYDFIVVGSGPSGSVVASRLSEDPNIKVLLLEAGKSDISDPSLHIPGSREDIFKPNGIPFDWKYLTTPQKSMANVRVVPWASGKVLGGGSTINYMNYVRGSPHDYDSWRDHGADGWGFSDVEPFFRRIENATAKNMSRKLGRSGPLKLTKRFEEATPMSELFYTAAKEIGVNIVDYIDEVEGMSPPTVSMFGQIRQNAVTAYLRPVHKKRKERLHIVTEALATKVLLKRDGEKLMATGVRYLKHGKYYDVAASKEVILCGGVVGSPKLLLLSGIGPRKHLENLTIPVLVDLPGVGSNLQDHVITVFPFTATNLSGVKDQIRSPEMQYILEGKGRLSGYTELLLHARSSFSGTPVSLSSRKRPFPEIQLYMTDGTQFPSPYPFDIYVNFNHPKSRGTIRLRSTDPEEYPDIDPNYYVNEDDITIHTEGFRLLEKFENSQAFQKAGAKIEFPNVCNATTNANRPRTDEFYRCLLLTVASAGVHACGTAKIGGAGDRYAVVDPRLRVYGVQGLRVADASVMPHVVSVNTAATCYMIGEKAADTIKKDWDIS